MIEIYLFSIAVIIILALSYMLFKMKIVIKEYEKLFFLNKTSDFDIEDFCSKLKTNKFINGIEINVKYENYNFYKKIGNETGKLIERNIEYKDFKVRVVIYTKCKNEDYLIMNIYVDFLSLNIFLNATLKLYTIIKSFENLKAFQLHSIHELKNIIQMLNFLNYKYRVKEFEELSFKLNKLLSFQTFYDKSVFAKTVSSLELKKFLKAFLKLYPVKFDKLILKPSKNIPKVYFLILENLLQNVYEEGVKCELILKDKDIILKNKIKKQIDVNNIFNPFYTSKKSGLGLGLFIVKKAVIETNGNINVEISDNYFTIKINFDTIGKTN